MAYKEENSTSLYLDMRLEDMTTLQKVQLGREVQAEFPHTQAAVLERAGHQPELIVWPPVDARRLGDVVIRVVAQL